MVDTLKGEHPASKWGECPLPPPPSNETLYTDMCIKMYGVCRVLAHK